MNKLKILFLLTGSLIFSSVIFSQTSNLFSVENRLKFGNHLFHQKDYLRAVYEYQEILKVSKNDTVKFKLAFSLGKMNRLDEAFDNYKGLIFNSSLEDESKLYLLRNRFLNGDLNSYREMAGNMLYIPEKYNLSNERLLKYSMLYSLNTLPENEEYFDCYETKDQIKIKDFFKRRKFPEKKDVWTAGILSAVIPGAGKIYTEEYTDGITAFLLTGVLTYIAVDNLNDGHDTRGWIFAGLASYFYAGNIYGSIASAQLFNAKIEFDLLEEIGNFLIKENYFLPELKFVK